MVVKIWVKSQDENLPADKAGGSAFYFTLPFVPVSHVEKAETVKTNDDDVNKNICILVVEDDNTNFLLLQAILHKINAKILHSKTGAEAINIFRKNTNINLVLMDIKLPDTDGLKVTKQIKKIRSNVPVIAQSAYAFQGDKEKAIKAGCIDYISKPIVIADLISTVKKYVPKNSLKEKM